MANDNDFFADKITTHSTLAQNYREAGFPVAAAEHEKLVEKYTILSGTSQDEMAATYPVSKSILIDAIARHNYEFVSGSSYHNWADLDDFLQQAYLDEAALLYEFLLDQGWTSPTI